MKPEISVIMSVYNDEKYIAKAIDSILTQSFSNFELIICDDYSTDRSSNIIEKYVKQDNRIVFFKNEKNLGLATSLNRCIERAKGKYIARMDSDDISLPNRFEVEYNYLEDNSDIVVVGCKCQCIDENDEIYKDFQIHSGSVSFYDAIKKVQIVHPTVMMRKEALLSVDGYTVNNLTLRAEDYDLWCKMTKKGYKIFNLDTILLLYREGLQGMKKRKYKFRIQEAKLKYMWMKNEKVPFSIYLYAVKPLIVVLIPSSLMKIYKGVR